MRADGAAPCRSPSDPEAGWSVRFAELTVAQVDPGATAAVVVVELDPGATGRCGRRARLGTDRDLAPVAALFGTTADQVEAMRDVARL